MDGRELLEVNHARDKIIIKHESNLNRDTVAFSSLESLDGESHGFDANGVAGMWTALQHWSD